MKKNDHKCCSYTKLNCIYKLVFLISILNISFINSLTVSNSFQSNSSVFADAKSALNKNTELVISSSNISSSSSENSKKQPVLSSRLYYQLESKKVDNYFKSNKNLMLNQINSSYMENLKRDNKSEETIDKTFKTDKNATEKEFNSIKLSKLENRQNSKKEKSNLLNEETEIINQQLDSILNRICNSKISIIQSLNNIDSDAKNVNIKLEKLRNSNKTKIILDFTSIVNEINSLKSELLKISFLVDTLKQANCENIEDISLSISKSEGNISTAFETIQAFLHNNKSLSALKLVILS